MQKRKFLLMGTIVGIVALAIVIVFSFGTERNLEDDKITETQLDVNDTEKYHQDESEEIRNELADDLSKSKESDTYDYEKYKVDGGPSALHDYWDFITEISNVTEDELNAIPNGLAYFTIIQPDCNVEIMQCYKALSEYLESDISEIVKEGYVSKLDYDFGKYYYLVLDVNNTMYLVYLDDTNAYVKTVTW